MDHWETTCELSLTYEGKEVITTTLAYTPAASRSTLVSNSIAPLSNYVDSQIGGTTAKQTKNKRSLKKVPSMATLKFEFNNHYGNMKYGT